MNITVKQAREELEAAHTAYIQADHDDVTSAKESLDNARHTFWNACAAFCTKLEFSTSLDQVESELIAHGLWA